VNLETIKAGLPDYAKDLRLNLDSVLSESGAPGLSAKQVAIIALASAIASRYEPLTQAIAEQASAVLSPAEADGARAAGSTAGPGLVARPTVHRQARTSCRMKRT